MASKDSSRLWLKDFNFYAGVINNPQQIGVDDVDPISRFTGSILGWGVRGSTNLQVPRTYAQAIAETPGVTIRMDLTQKDLKVDFELFQVADVELWQQIFGLESQANVPIVTPTAKTINIAHFGYDEPFIQEQCFLLDGEDVNDRRCYVFLYWAKNVATDSALAFSGTDYAKGKMSLMAFPHPQIASPQRALGSLIQEL